MVIKEEITKIEGLAAAIANEIDVWFEKHFSPGATSLSLDQVKAELHETLGTAAAASAPATSPQS